MRRRFIVYTSCGDIKVWTTNKQAALEYAQHRMRMLGLYNPEKTYTVVED